MSSAHLPRAGRMPQLPASSSAAHWGARPWHHRQAPVSPSRFQHAAASSYSWHTDAAPPVGPRLSSPAQVAKPTQQSDEHSLPTQCTHQHCICPTHWQCSFVCSSPHAAPTLLAVYTPPNTHHPIDLSQPFSGAACTLKFQGSGRGLAEVTGRGRVASIESWARGAG